MKAMILAAGMGTRLKPLTDGSPKALIEVGGKPLIGYVLERLVGAGVDSVIVNAFHLANLLEDYLKTSAPKGLRVSISREAELLDTGGGLKQAAYFFEGEEPFFIHNVDVLSDIDLVRMYREHVSSAALATLAVQERASGRALLFDKKGLLRGRVPGEGLSPEWASTPVEGALRRSFCGVHVVSPALLSKMTETGVFPILSAYLRLAGEGEAFRAFAADGYRWQDVGSVEKLESARRSFLT